MGLKSFFINKIVLNRVKKRQEKARLYLSNANIEGYKLQPKTDKKEVNSYTFYSFNSNSKLFVKILYKYKELVDVDIVYCFNKAIYKFHKNNTPIEKPIIDIECLDIGESWKIRFNGKALDAKGTEVTLKFDLEFRGVNPLIEYSRDLNPRAFAKAIVAKLLTYEKTPDNIDATNNIDNPNEVYYDQTGLLKGNVSFNGSSNTIELICFRNHFFGYDDFNYIQRYLKFYIKLENGEVINILLRRSDALPNFQAGFYECNNHINYSLLESDNIDDIDLNIHKGNSISISVFFDNKQTFTIKGDLAEDIINLNDDKFYKQVSKYNFLVNDQKGEGFLEIGFLKQFLVKQLQNE